MSRYSISFAVAQRQGEIRHGGAEQREVLGDRHGAAEQRKVLGDRHGAAEQRRAWGIATGPREETYATETWSSDG
jgi:hypothetical protein